LSRVQARLITSGSDSQNELPGLKSVASATTAPSSINVRAGGQRKVQEERAGRKQYGCHITAGELLGTFVSSGLQMIHAAGSQVYGELDRAALGELYLFITVPGYSDIYLTSGL
jgi:hypothetical protein